MSTSQPNRLSEAYTALRHHSAPRMAGRLFRSESALRYVHAYDGEPELRWDLAVGLRRSDDALVDAVNEALTRLKRDGNLARIYQGYGADYRQP